MSPPRPLDERLRDTRRLLEADHADAWVATASADGVAHLVPLSFAWNGTDLILATDADARTTRNIERSSSARVAIGASRDVVMVDVALERIVTVSDAPAELAERYADQADWDPRSSGGEMVYLVLRPVRIQAWREADEIAGRTLMRAGAWLA